MALIPGLLFFLVIIGLTAGLIISMVRRGGVSGQKLMLLGIHITLFGGIIAVDPNSNLGGFEYLIALAGLFLSIFGLGKNE